MISEQKLQANRRNALLSTGPRTPEGKALSSQNATTHGLSAATLISEHDNPHFQPFLDQMLAHLSPQNALQHFLAQRITLLAFKLHRHRQAEVHLLNSTHRSACDQVDIANQRKLQQHDQDYRYTPGKKRPPAPAPYAHPSADPAVTLASLFLTHTDANNPLSRLQRYELSLERSLHKSLALYKILQSTSPPDPDPISQNEPTEQRPVQPYDNQPILSTADAADPPALQPQQQQDLDHSRQNEPTEPIADSKNEMDPAPQDPIPPQSSILHPRFP